MSSVARLSFDRFCLRCGKNEKISIFDANLTAFRWWCRAGKANFSSHGTKSARGI
jgi:hypothetical protein